MEGFSVVFGVFQIGFGREVVVIWFKIIKLGKVLVKIWWVEFQNVVVVVVVKVKMVMSIFELEGVVVVIVQYSVEFWVRMGGKRIKKFKYLDDEYESSEEEREFFVVLFIWRVLQFLLMVWVQLVFWCLVVLRFQIFLRYVLCLLFCNVMFL